MKDIRDIMHVLIAPHTFGQKWNYIKYGFSKKSEVLSYDPVTISIVGTTRCTLSCDMCPTHSALVPRDYPHTQKNVKDCVDKAQHERVVITRHGKPAAVLVGVEGEDWEAVVLQTDPAFWKLIRARRKQSTISLRQIRTRLRVKK